MNRAEVQVLIDSHGADAARWPVDLRAAAEAVIAADPELQAQRADAVALDVLLDGWARRLPVAADAAAIAARIVRPVLRWPRVAGFGGLAAAAVAALVLVSLPSLAPPSTTVAATPADDAAAFAAIFTLTPDEENLI